MRQVTKLLSYPVTIASVVHELSPYNIRKNGRLTVEGLKSLTGKQHLQIRLIKTPADHVQLSVTIFTLPGEAQVQVSKASG